MKYRFVREISSARMQELKEFIVLERRLLERYALFVSNFDQSLIRYLTGRSAFTREMKLALFVASNESADVARCAALINPKYQQAKDEKVGFIGFFAAAPGCEPYLRAMLERAEDWLRERGVQRIIAPFNGNALLGMGFLTAAFDEEPVMFAGWNPPYYATYFTQAGFQPTYPLFVYSIDFTSPKYLSALERARANRDIHVRPINLKQWQSELEIFRQIINDNFTQEWEWYPLTSEEFLEFFGQFKPMIDPRQMLIAEVQGKPVSVQIGIPNWNSLARGFKGKLGPWQKIQFLLRGRRYEAAGLVFTAVLPEYRGIGISPLLAVTICNRYQELGVKKACAYFINEDNDKSRKPVESIGGVGRILYHAYDKRM